MNPSSQQYEVFLSHNSKDKNFINALDQWLRNNEVKTWSNDGTVKLWSLDGGKTQVFRHDNSVFGVKLYKGKLLTWSYDGTAKLWPLDGGDPQIFKHDQCVSGAELYGDQLLTWSYDGTAKIWDLSIDDSISLEERIRDLEKRTGKRFDQDSETLRDIPAKEFIETYYNDSRD